MSNLFLEILDKNRLSVFQSLSNFAPLGVLGGGTAISLQLGHRRSFDFDIFTLAPFPQNLWKRIRQALGPGCVKTLETDDQLNLITPSNVAVTFFYDDYPLLFPPIPVAPLPLMNLFDLATNKARTIGKRGKWRDYVDLYELLKSGQLTLDQVIKLSEERFQKEFPTRLFLQQLVYFEDITDYTIDFIDTSVDPKIIKNYFANEVKRFEKQNLTS